MAKILVIDDDAQLLRMVGLMLERGGHTTTLMTNPVEGLNAIKANKPDLLVLDVMMPNINGHDLTRQIRATKGLENLPILILTARSQEVDRVTALHSGANDYLSKPVATQELIERIDKLLQNYEPQETAVRKGTVIACYGLRGGRGQTTLAVNLAAALRRASQKEVCLVDFAASGSQSLIHLRLQARKNWADVAPVVGLNWELLNEQMSIHPSGLRLLPGPSVAQMPLDLAADATRRLLDLLREQMMFTVVDLPTVFNTPFKTTLAEADMALHVIAPDVVSAQTAVQLNQAIEEAKIQLKQRLYVLNQTMPDPQIPKTAVERAVGSRISLQVDYDPNQLKAITQGVPLTLTKASSPIPKFATRLAQAIWQHVSAG
ncbi:MAG: response regulator [Chloroflexota bacterium]